MPARCPLPRCPRPRALCRSVSPRPPSQPRTTKCPLEHPPCPALCVSMHTFPRHCQLEMVIPALCGAVRSHGQPWERLGLQTRPQMCPCGVGVTGSAEPSREQLCLHPCASSLGTLCPLAAGTGQGPLSVSPPAARPCPSSPSRVAGAVCAPPTALLDCWKLSRKEAAFPLGLPGGTVTSGGCRGGHPPGTNTSCCAGCFS